MPATPLEHSGSVLKAQDLAHFLHHPRVTGLGEMMDFYGVSQCDPDILEKLSLYRNKVLDGHLPSVPQELLQPYAAAGIQKMCIRDRDKRVFITEGLRSRVSITAEGYMLLDSLS